MQEVIGKGSPIHKIKIQRCPACMAPLSEADPVCRSCGQDLPVENESFCLPAGTVLENGKNRYLIGKCTDAGDLCLSYTGWDIDREEKIRIEEYYLQGVFERNGSFVICPEERRKYQEYGEKAFEKEARNLERLKHIQNIVHFRDFFEANGTAYIVTDFPEGVSLEEWISRKGPVSFSESIRILGPLILAVEEMHACGLIHRDIHPSNILLSESLEPILMGLGASRSYEGDSSDHASNPESMEAGQHYTVMTKAGYSPPEQYAEDSIQGPWGDVYGICATIYTMITGRIPDAAVRRLGQDVLPKPSDLGADISSEEEDALMKGLAPFTGERWRSVKNLYDALAGASSGKEEKAHSSLFRPLWPWVLFPGIVFLLILSAILFGKKKAETETAPLLSFNYNGHSYGLYSLKEAHIEDGEGMKRFCESIGGYPAAISDLDENRLIYNQLLSAGFRSAFFGYIYVDSAGGFTWTRKEKGDFAFWSARTLDSMPEGGGGTWTARFHPDLQNGQWDFGKLTDPSAFFLCEWDHEERREENASLTELWEESSFIFGEHRFSLLNMDTYGFELQGQTDSEDDFISYRALCEYCYVRGAYPAVIADKDMNAFLYEKVLKAGQKSAFFGLSCWEDGETWSWTDGRSSFGNWAKDKPDQTDGSLHTKNFARFMADGGGLWENTALTDGTKIFIIEWDN